MFTKGDFFLYVVLSGILGYTGFLIKFEKFEILERILFVVSRILLFFN